MYLNALVLLIGLVRAQEPLTFSSGCNTVITLRGESVCVHGDNAALRDEEQIESEQEDIDAETGPTDDQPESDDEPAPTFLQEV